MADVVNLHDPLSLRLDYLVQHFASQLPTDAPARAVLQQPFELRTHLLDTLSELLLDPSLTVLVANTFRPILFDLCARFLHLDEERREEALVTLALLIEVHEELYSILLQLLQSYPPHEGPLSSLTRDEPKDPPIPRTFDPNQRILLAYYRILVANRYLAKYLVWPLSPLVSLTAHVDVRVRFLAIRCYAVQAGLVEREREKLEKKWIGEVGSVELPLEYGTDASGQLVTIDGWLLPFLESKRIAAFRQSLSQDACDYYGLPSTTPDPLTPADLSSRTEYIHGVLMLRSGPPRFLAPTLIHTPTATTVLRSLALHVTARLPTLLTSAPSCGKSLLLSHLAERLHPNDALSQIVTIHLADKSLEARALLGSYVSSPSDPGSFEWREGVLVRAMREGKWIVLEDVDQGSNEILGLFSPLIESMRPPKMIGQRPTLDVLNHGKIEAHDTFRLFATRSLQSSCDGTFTTPTFLAAHKYHEIVLSTPSQEELYLILGSRYPQLSGAPVRALVRLWEDLRSLDTTALTRESGLRDLDKLCRRISSLPVPKQDMRIDDGPDEMALPLMFPNPTLREDIFLEARDVFFGFGATSSSGRAHLESVSQTVAKHLGLGEDRKEWLLHGYSPDWKLEPDVNGRPVALVIGHARVSARVSTAPLERISRPFSMHKPAVNLMHRISKSVVLCEPVLLTGETGTGKTSVITHLAAALNRPLISLNLSHQTEASDLLGGFKPLDARTHAYQLQDQFTGLFGQAFSRKKNAKFEESVRKAVVESKWKRATTLWLEAVRLAKERYETIADRDILDSQGSRKRRKTEGSRSEIEEWHTFETRVRAFEVHHLQPKSKMAFTFVEGPLVKALRDGSWVLLDEVNLATSETLECLASLLQGPTASVTLTEQGHLDPIPRHPDFRLFACMNPATDVGKKDLPPTVRSRFTEIEVPPPDIDRDTLLSIIELYIGHCAVGDKAAILDIAEFYTSLKALAEERKISDGSNQRPHYSMRTLARALTFASDTTESFGLRRALWDGCLMSFTMILDPPSRKIATDLAYKYIVSRTKNPRSLLARDSVGLPLSSIVGDTVRLGPFFLRTGPLPSVKDGTYVITHSVEAKLSDLARLILTGRFPVLIEGPTSSGKTSTIEYIARLTGHQFVRINNHEHTDIQEYLGTYITDPITGKLVFKEGLLVRALREGHWIVLDELNLAPTDVLEALNRLLDDNRELFIPQTQEVVRPHQNFMLFATQNPPGLYAGRKVLSRAFRNRFLEVHFDDVPQDELENILCKRTNIAPEYGKRLVSVFTELQKRRQSSRVFESKQGFATLRDLFRWAGRDAVGYQELAENGYMLLAERARQLDDRLVVKAVIEQTMGVRIDEKKLYDFQNSDRDMASYLGCPLPTTQLVWTSTARRLFVLLSRALRFNEPVLLVGETGTGKTSICEVYADVLSQRLHTVSCHQNTETADIIGGQRPVRNRSTVLEDLVRDGVDLLLRLGVENAVSEIGDLAKHVREILKLRELSSSQREEVRLLARRLRRAEAIFEWHDGPLVQAMKNGELLLLDEISLADDSVLERLNSVLEPSRTLVLAEKGEDDLAAATVHAASGFRVIATMNPGGDFGKKELSPALRNRFTEIWVPVIDDHQDLERIIQSSWKHDILASHTKPLLDFTGWLSTECGDRALISVRDLLAWVSFSNTIVEIGRVPLVNIFHHAAALTCLDGLDTLPQTASFTEKKLRTLHDDALQRLNSLMPLVVDDPDAAGRDELSIGPFSIRRGPMEVKSDSFNLEVPTVRGNAMRVLRACQLSKPVLLEGSPGVGKTSLVSALANAAGYAFHRINLSDQTDLTDLFGSDLPVEGGETGRFAWKDAEFLVALQEGHWVLLDEMNLAPQAVLEGLNAVLDHRGSIFIPELGRSFTKHTDFRVFAAQNPMHQGGGRKGLPKSFVNRFTKVFVQGMTPSDQSLICHRLFPSLPPPILDSMILYASRMNEEVGIKRTFARDGTPWEFNLRDVMRWASLVQKSDRNSHPREYVDDLFFQRFRSSEDRRQASALFDTIFGSAGAKQAIPSMMVSAETLQVGHFRQFRSGFCVGDLQTQVLSHCIAALRAFGTCASANWLVILTGGPNAGKSSLVRLAARLTGNNLHEMTLNNATDTSDLLGGFEQMHSADQSTQFLSRLLKFCDDRVRSSSSHSFSWSKSQDDLRRVLAERGKDAHTLIAFARATITSWLSFAVDKELYQLSRELDKITQAINDKGRFEWVDGPLVRALKEGHWLVLDGANLCSPSVLDRLNSVCEENGTLVLSEKGDVNAEIQRVHPHPSFRLFMTVDPRYGELSRAMRNRGAEIFMEQVERQPLAPDILGPSWSSFVPRETVVALQLRHRCLGDSSTRLIGSSPASLFLEVEHLALAAVSMFENWFHQPDLVQLDSATALAAAVVLHTAPSEVAYLRRLLLLIKSPQLRLVCIETVTALFTDKFVNLVRDIHAQWDPKGVPFFSTQPLGEFDGNHDLIPTVSIARTKAHAVILDMIRIKVSLQTKRITVLAQQRAQDDAPSADNSSLAERLRRLESSIVEIITSVLESVDLASINEGVIDLPLCWRILRYCVYLNDVMGPSLMDYSRILEAMTSLTHLLQGKFLFQDAKTDLDDILRLLKPTTGQYLAQLWYAFLPSTAVHDQVSETIIELDDLLRSKITGAELRSQALNLMAMGTVISTPANPTLESWLDMTRSLCQVIRKLKANKPTNGVDNPTEGLVVVTHELTILARFLIPARSNVKFLDRPPPPTPTQDWAAESNIKLLLSLACDSPSSSLVRFSQYQKALWEAESGEVAPATAAHLHINWLEAIWKVEAGPLLLSGPSLLSETLRLCQRKGEPLAFLATHRFEVKRLISAIHAQNSLMQTRDDQLLEFFMQSVYMVFCSIKGRDVRLSKGPESISRTRSMDIRTCVGELGTFLTGLDLSPGDDANRMQLEACLNELLLSISHGASITLKLGACWIAFARLLLDFYVPNIPLDPHAMNESSREYWAREQNLINLELKHHGDLQEQYPGRGSSAGDLTRDYFICLQQQILQRDQNTTSTPRRGHDVTELTAFWTEILQFKAQILASARFTSLQSSPQKEGELREQMVQDSITEFLQRLRSTYPLYSDLKAPFELAMLQMKLGIRLQLVGASTNSSTQELALALLCYPKIRCAEAIRGFLAFPGVRVAALGHSPPLLHLASIAYDADAGVPLGEHGRALDVVYDQIYRLWSIERAKEKEEDSANQSLYRQKRMDDDPLTDSELEAREFLDLFPDFDAVLSSADDTSLRPSDRGTSSSSADLLFALHLNLFSSQSAVTLNQSSADIFQELRVSSIRTLLSAQSLPSVVDSESTAFQLALLHQHTLTLSDDRKASARLYDFYHDSNIGELQRATAILEELHERLQLLLDEWPDQMVLRSLAERCDRILLFDLTSSVAQMLAALEQLLLQGTDWEGYANKENSLRVYWSSITSLVIDWRRLELTSWNSLLAREERQCTNGAQEWWFRLYETFVVGPSTLNDEDEISVIDLENYLTSVIPLLEEFMVSTPLGQFQARLDLLLSFADFLDHPRHAGSKKLALRKVSHIIRSFHRLYQRRAFNVSNSLTRQRAEIEKEVQGFIKLASWKDVNVQALKQSAARTHHHLYKSIRKFREVLRQPVTPYLAVFHSKDIESSADCVVLAPLPFVSSTEIPDWNGSYPKDSHLIRLSRTLQRFESLISPRVRALETSAAAIIIDGISTEIIGDVTQLKALSIPKEMVSTKRKKLRSSIHARKRRAWQDLLKEMKRLGFSPHMKVDVQERLVDRRWLFEQPKIPKSLLRNELARKTEDYFDRLHEMLPNLLSNMPNHHPDINIRDLQRGVSTLQSGFNMALQTRSSVYENTAYEERFHDQIRRLDMLMSNPSVFGSGRGVVEHLAALRNSTLRIVAALREVVQALATHVAITDDVAKSSFSTTIHSLISAGETFGNRLATLAETVNLTDMPFLLQDEHTLTEEVCAYASEVMSSLRGHCIPETSLCYVLQPTLHWLERHLPTALRSSPEARSSQADLDHVVNFLLVVMQKLVSLDHECEPPSEERADNFLRDKSRSTLTITSILDVKGVVAEVDRAVAILAQSDAYTVKQSLERIMPFLRVYAALLSRQLIDHLRWSKSLFKLTYVLFTVVESVSTQGFCLPPETLEDDSGNGESETMSLDGTGLGEGSGNQNISDQIEEKSQVEGLKNERQEEPTEEDAKDAEAIEMDDDFEGRMEDAPDEDGEAKDEGSESEDELDEHVGDVDASDPSAVDEKLWGDEKGPENSAMENETTAPDRSKQSTDAAELAAKERERQATDAPRPRPEENMPPPDGVESLDDRDQLPEDMEPPSEGGAPLDDLVPDANTLDLPDDLELGANGEPETLDEGEDEDEDALEDGLQADVQDVPETMSHEEAEQSHDATNAELGDEEDNETERASSEHPTQQPEGPNDEGSDKQISSFSDVREGDDDGSNMEQDEHASAEQKDSGRNTGLEGALANTFNTDTEKDQPEAKRDPVTHETKGDIVAHPEAEGHHFGQERAQGVEAASTQAQMQTNPLRSLGDAMKEIRKRFDDILMGHDHEKRAPQMVENVDELAPVEYLHPDDEDLGMQALGTADEDKAANLNDLHMVEDSTNSLPPQPMDIDGSVDLGMPPPPPPYDPHQRHQQPPAEKDSLEGALESRDIRSRQLGGAVVDAQETSHSVATEPVEDQPMRDDQTVVEAALRQWQVDGYPQEHAGDIWRLYESITHDLSYALCEQLRLILEPTMATRLKGDYRTGKRLNMKKIIPYIASEYTKDKIWLRRTRPSQREYQVLIALDDSRSMAESHSIHLAYQTLALVSKALSRLEVGDIAIAKFGDGVDVLHGFDGAPFSDQAGAAVMGAFTFAQKATDVLSLMRTSIQILSDSRESRSTSSSSAADLWQLMVVISDGICQDHDQLRSMLRRAEEQRVMVVFVIVDALHPNAPLSGTEPLKNGNDNSILTMQQVAYKNVDGKMEIQMKHYLDTFPFEYYVVLRNVEALPDVLSSTIKQFFERIAGE